MLSAPWIIGRKELVDSARDRRSALSSLLFCLMGPAVVLTVGLAMKRSSSDGQTAVLNAMMAVFTLLSTFTGGMNVAMDVLAGERERRSLLPLILNAVPRREILVGKWLAVSCFCLAGVLVTFAAFTAVRSIVGLPRTDGVLDLLMLLGCGLMPLAAMAAALELVISTACRSLKEAHTYLAMLVFCPMAVSMYVTFNPDAAHGWVRLLPVVGQLWLLQSWFHADTLSLWHGIWSGWLTITAAAAALAWAGRLLQRDDIVYGN